MPRFFSTPEVAAIDALKCSGVAFGQEVVAEYYRHPVDKRLVEGSALALQDRVRQLLKSPNEKHQLAATRVNEEFLASDQNAFNQTAAVEQHLGETAILDWVSVTSSDDIVNFAQWNVERQRELLFALDDDHDMLVESSLQKVENLIALGFFPKSALDAVYRTSKDLALFRPIDSFESGSRGAAGSYNTEQGIAFKNLYENPTSFTGVGAKLERVMFHELLHATGHTNGMGFTFGQSEDAYGRLWEEAFVSHAASVALQGDNPQLDIYDPRARSDGNKTYLDERRLLDVLSSRYIANISPDVWATAFFSQHNSPSHLEPAYKLQTAFSLMQNPQIDELLTFNEAYEHTWRIDDEVVRGKLMQQMVNRAVHLLTLRDDVIYEDIEPINEPSYQLITLDRKY